MNWYVIIGLIIIAFGVIWFFNTQKITNTYKMDVTRQTINDQGIQHTQFTFNYYDLLFKRDNGFTIKADNRTTLTERLKINLTDKLNNNKINNFQYQNAKIQLASYSYII